MLISQLLITQIENAANQWIAENHPKGEKPFKIATMANVEYLYKLFEEKLSTSAACYDRLQHIYKDSYETEGYYGTRVKLDQEDQYFEELSSIYKLNIKSAVHTFGLFAPFFDHRYDARIWEDIVSHLGNDGNFQSLPLKVASAIRHDGGRKFSQLRSQIIYYILLLRGNSDSPYQQIFSNIGGNDLISSICQDIAPEYRNIRDWQTFNNIQKMETFLQQNPLSAELTEECRHCMQDKDYYWEKNVQTRVDDVVIGSRDFVSLRTFKALFYNYLSQPDYLSVKDSKNVGQPQNKLKDMIAQFLDSTDWGEYCSHTGYKDSNSRGLMTSDFVPQRYEPRPDKLKEGTVIKIELSSQQVPDGRKHGESSVLFLKLLSIKDQLYEVLKLKGTLSNLKTGNRLTIVDYASGSPLKYIKDEKYFESVENTSGATDVEAVEVFDAQYSTNDNSLGWTDILLEQVIHKAEKDTQKSMYRKGNLILKRLSDIVGISKTTLGRIYGKSGYIKVTRKAEYESKGNTMDKMAQYIEYESYKDFVERFITHVRSTPYEFYTMSSFKEGDTVSVNYDPRHSLRFTLIRDTTGQGKNGLICRINHIIGSHNLREDYLFTFEILRIGDDIRLTNIIKDTGEPKNQDYVSGSIQRIKVNQ